MARPAILNCPRCEDTEDPLRHTYNSRCGGVIYWHNGTLQCECGTRIYEVRCDTCRSSLSTRVVD